MYAGTSATASRTVIEHVLRTHSNSVRRGADVKIARTVNTARYVTATLRRK
jgi:hypothetical protein